MKIPASSPPVGPSTLVVILGTAFTSCAGETGPAQIPNSINVQPAAHLVTAVGAEEQFTALVRDQNGAIISNAFVIWRSDDRAIATIDPGLGRVTAVGPGQTMIRASSGTTVGTATMEVFLDEPVAPFFAGETYFGRADYIEYLAGNLPIIVSAPHGGTQEPSEIPDRTTGIDTQDTNTEDLARRIAAAITTRTGATPHLVISRLHRRKLDPNREVIEAAQGNPFAELAWEEYHRFLEVARFTVAQEWGSGLYVDIHGHGHQLQRIELGYLLSADQLAMPAAALEALAGASSIRAAAAASDSTFVAVLRGPSSIGGLLEDEGYEAVPGPTAAAPGGTPYFSGAYSAATHGSRDGGPVSAVQIELHFDGVRSNVTDRQAFAEALTRVIETYLAVHLGIDWVP